MELSVKIPTSRSELYSYWQQFKSVAHLWAESYLAACGAIPHRHPLDSPPENFLAFLARAEQFRRFGIQHIPKRLKPPRPTLSPEETWTVPASLVLPDIEVNVPPLTEQQQRALRTYRNR